VSPASASAGAELVAANEPMHAADPAREIPALREADRGPIPAGSRVYRFVDHATEDTPGGHEALSAWLLRFLSCEP
jgi:hypothetical protein